MNQIKNPYYIKFSNLIITIIILFVGIFISSFLVNKAFADGKTSISNNEIGLTTSGRILAFNHASIHKDFYKASDLAKTLIEQDKLTKYIPKAIYYSFLDGGNIQAEKWYKQIKTNQNNEINEYLKIQLRVYEAVNNWNNNSKQKSKFNSLKSNNDIIIEVINFWRNVSENPSKQNVLAEKQLKAWKTKYKDGFLVSELSSLLTLFALSDNENLVAKQKPAKEIEQLIELQSPALISIVLKQNFDISAIEGKKLLTLLRINSESVISANNWKKEYSSALKLSARQKAGIMMMYIGISQFQISPEQTLFFSKIAQFLNNEDDFANYWTAKALVSISDTIGYVYRIDRSFKAIAKISKNSNMYLQASILKSNIFKIDKKWKLAHEALKVAKNLYSKMPHLYFEEGVLYSTQEKYALAIDSYTKGISYFGQKYSENLNYYFRRGIAFEKLDNWLKAESDLKKALEINPNQPHVLNYLAYSWVIKGINLKEAFEMLFRANKLLPGRAFVIDSLGWALYHQKRYDEATRILEQAIVISPLDPEINDHLGDVYWKRGRQTEAKVQWKRSLQFNNGNVNEENLQSKLKNGL